MRKSLIAASALLVALSGVCVAPAAQASGESVQVSSLSSGVPVSGTASRTVTVSEPDALLQIYLPTALFSASTFFYFNNPPTHPTDAAACGSTYGITLSVNGAPLIVDECASDFTLAYGILPDHYAFYAFKNATPVVAGDVITMTWGTAYASSVASLSGQTVWVQDAGTPVPVVLTGPSAPPAPGGGGGGGYDWESANSPDNPAWLPTPTPTPTPTAPPSPVASPSASPEVVPPSTVLPGSPTFAEVPLRVNGQVTPGVSTVPTLPPTGVWRVTERVAQAPSSAPTAPAPLGTVVSATLTGLEANTEFAVTMGPAAQARSTFMSVSRGAVGRVRSTASGRVVLPGLKATKPGIYVVQLQSSTGVTHFVKFAFAKRPRAHG